MGRRSRPWAKGVLFGVFAAAVVFAGGGTAFHWWQTPFSVASRVETDESQGKRAVHLYFADPGERHLVGEQRTVESSGDDVALSRRLIELLIQGPRQKGVRTLPADAELRAVYITDGGTAFLDFEAQAFDNHPGGAAAELLSIYAIVNTLVLNVDSVRSVKLLFGGREAATLVGHLDLKHPYEVDMLWVR